MVESFLKISFLNRFVVGIGSCARGASGCYALMNAQFRHLPSASAHPWATLTAAAIFIRYGVNNKKTLWLRKQ
jgi:hypothetical protein